MKESMNENEVIFPVQFVSLEQQLIGDIENL